MRCDLDAKLSAPSTYPVNLLKSCQSCQKSLPPAQIPLPRRMPSVKRVEVVHEPPASRAIPKAGLGFPDEQFPRPINLLFRRQLVLIGTIEFNRALNLRHPYPLGPDLERVA